MLLLFFSEWRWLTNDSHVLQGMQQKYKFVLLGCTYVDLDNLILRLQQLYHYIIFCYVLVLAKTISSSIVCPMQHVTSNITWTQTYYEWLYNLVLWVLYFYCLVLYWAKGLEKRLTSYTVPQALYIIAKFVVACLCDLYSNFMLVKWPLIFSVSASW